MKKTRTKTATKKNVKETKNKNETDKENLEKVISIEEEIFSLDKNLIFSLE